MSRCPHCGGTHGADNHFCPATGKPIELGPRLIGQTLLDHFKVITILGEGPVGIVLEIEDMRTRKRLAAKLIHPQFTRGPNAADKLLAEAKKAGRLACDHIARVIEVGRDTGAAPTVVRELMTGQCLEDRIEEQGQMRLSEAATITREILLALKAIHDAGMLNLDLSPADVFLDTTSGAPVAKLVDLGEGHIKSEVTLEDGEVPESHKYYAPEQRRAGSKSDRRADVYAAGAILYHMIAGKTPERIPSPVNSLRKEVDPKLAAVVHKSLAAAPENRYASADDFLAALEEAASKLLAQPAPAPAAEAPVAPTPVAPTKKTLLAVPGITGTPPGAAPAAPQAPPASPPDQLVPEPPPVDLVPEPPAPSPPPDEPAVEAEPTSPEEELAQPSVIVDMPEVERAASRKKVMIGVGVVAAVAIVVAIVFVFMQGDDGAPEEQPQEEKIKITIAVTPDKATVTVDGKRVEGNPPVLEVLASNDLHTIRAKAEGYESLEKDVTFDSTKTIPLELMEIVAPAEEPPAEEQGTPDVEEITPPETPPEAQPEPEPEPEPEVEPEPEPEPEVEPEPPKKPAKPAAAPPKKPAKKPAPPPKKPAKPPAAKPEKPPAKKPGKKKGGFTTSNPYG